MITRCHFVEIVFFCTDCNHIVATEMVQIEKPLSKTTKAERYWLVHEVLLDAVEDGTISKEMMTNHNLGSMLNDCS